MNGHPWPDRTIAAHAARQGSMVDYAQLRAAGVSRAAIGRAVRRGRLHRVHTGVYSLVPSAARPRWAAEHAALLATGPGAVLSHETAAAVLGLRLPGLAPPREIHITVPADSGARGRTRPGIRVHRTRDLPTEEITRRGRLRLTSVARTTADLAPALDPRGLAEVVDQALRQTTRTKLRAAASRHPGKPGLGLLHAVLDPARPSREAFSETERRLARMLERAGVPAAESNVPIGRLMPDLLWREYRVIAEYDSDLFHFEGAGRRRTWERHDHFGAHGYDVVHITWDELRHHTSRALTRVVAALVRGGWVPGG